MSSHEEEGASKTAIKNKVLLKLELTFSFASEKFYFMYVFAQPQSDGQDVKQDQFLIVVKLVWNQFSFS